MTQPVLVIDTRMNVVDEWGQVMCNLFDFTETDTFIYASCHTGADLDENFEDYEVEHQCWELPNHMLGDVCADLTRKLGRYPRKVGKVIEYWDTWTDVQMDYWERGVDWMPANVD